MCSKDLMDRSEGHMMNRLNVFVAAAFLMAGHSAVAQAPKIADFPMKDGMITFVFPTMDMECTFVPKRTEIYTPVGGGPELSCDRRDPSYVRVVIGPTGPAKRINNPGEQPCCGAENVLPYGQSWVGGPLSCQSAPTGLTCAHKNGHGFSMSKEKISVH
jgi:hypothetical protein